MTSKAYRGPTCMVYSTSRTLHWWRWRTWNLEVRKETENFLGLPNRGLMGSREEDRVCHTCWPMIWKSRMLIWLDPLLMGRAKWTLIFKYANFMIRDVLKHIEHDPTINLKWPKRRGIWMFHLGHLLIIVGPMKSMTHMEIFLSPLLKILYLWQVGFVGWPSPN